MDLKERVKRFWAWKMPWVRKYTQELIGTPAYQEETLSNYEYNFFYPARLGQCLDGRYDISAKLGYGRASTAWFCFDRR